MSVRCTAWVFHESPCTGNDRLVLLAIADEAGDDGTNGHPGYRLIATKARLHTDTVKRAVRRLERGGELLVLRPEVYGRGRFNRYVVVMGRNPVTLATELGWPVPALDRTVRAEWDADCTLSTSGENLGADEQKGAEGLHQRREKAAPDARRPLDPLTQGPLRSSVGENPSRRRGLDPRPPLPDEGIVAAQLARARENDEARARAAAEHQRATPEVAAAALDEARAALRRGRAS